jgi:hypothetical protein
VSLTVLLAMTAGVLLLLGGLLGLVCRRLPSAALGIVLGAVLLIAAGDPSYGAWLRQ